MQLIKDYIRGINDRIQQGDTTEETFYGDVDSFIEDIAEELVYNNIHITLLPKKTEVNNSDYNIWNGKYWLTLFGIILFTLTFGLPTQSIGQDRSIIERELKFKEGAGHPKEEFVDSIQYSITKAKASHKVKQSEIAERYYGLYEKFPETESGKQALVEAFYEWMELDSLERMWEVQKAVPINSDVWGNVIGILDFPFMSRGKTQELISYHKEWLKKAESKKSRTHIISSLGFLHKNIFQSYRSSKQEEWSKPRIYYQRKAIAYYEQLFEMNQDTLFSNNASVLTAAKNNYEDLINFVRIGKEAPNFSETSLSDEKIQLSDLTKDHVVLLDFWASWCAPCIVQIPELKELWQKYNDYENFRMISITIDRDKKPWKKVIQDSNLTWTHIFPGDSTYSDHIADKYGIAGVPMLFVIDRDGYVINKKLGNQPLDDLQKTISELLETTE